MRILHLSVLAAGLLVGCIPAHVVTTPVPTPAAGQRIRYAGTADTTEFIPARLVSLDNDSLVFERLVSQRPDLWVKGSLPTESVGRLQVHIGRRANAGRGALIGAVIGGALGVACAVSTDEGWFEPTPEQCLLAYTLTGAGTGLLVGALTRSDVWAPSALPRHRSPPPVASAWPPVSAVPVDIGIRIFF